MIEALALAAIVNKVVDFVKFVTNRNWNAVITQLAAWVAGVLITLLAANAAAAAFEGLFGFNLKDAGLWTQILIGLAVGSSGSLLKDGFNAVDNTASQATPALVPGGETVVAAPAPTRKRK